MIIKVCSWLWLSCSNSLRKKCPYSELFCSAFSRIRSEYGEILHISPYSIRMRENADQNNSGYRHFSCSEYLRSYYKVWQWKFVIECDKNFVQSALGIAKWTSIYSKLHLLLQSEAEFILQSMTRICHKVRKELHSWTEILSQSTLVIKNLLQSVLGTKKLYKNLLQSVLSTTKWDKKVLQGVLDITKCDRNLFHGALRITNFGRNLLQNVLGITKFNKKFLQVALSIIK